MEKLVYGHSLGSLVFMTETRANDYVCLRELDSRPDMTWGELRHSLPRLAGFLPSEGEVADTELLSSDAWGSPISDYWPFPHSEQLDLLPKDVIALGEIEDTGEGDRLYLDTADEDEIVRRLRSHGYEVRRDDALVAEACDG